MSKKVQISISQDMVEKLKYLEEKTALNQSNIFRLALQKFYENTKKENE